MFWGIGIYVVFARSSEHICRQDVGKSDESLGLCFIAEALTFQPEFAEPIVNISVAIGRDATFTCHVRHLGGYRVS